MLIPVCGTSMNENNARTGLWNLVNENKVNTNCRTSIKMKITPEPVYGTSINEK